MCAGGWGVYCSRLSPLSAFLFRFFEAIVKIFFFFGKGFGLQLEKEEGTAQSDHCFLWKKCTEVWEFTRSASSRSEA